MAAQNPHDGDKLKHEDRYIEAQYTEDIDRYLLLTSVFFYTEGLCAFLSSCDIVRPQMRVLDAGCGTGLLSTALIRALKHLGFDYEALHGFDLTPAMLDRFHQIITQRHFQKIELCRADVLALDEQLPTSWIDYDLVMSAAMLEYVPRAELTLALRNLYRRLASNGRLLLFVTRRNPITKWMIGRPWQANCYGRQELRDALAEAGFDTFQFHRFPWSYPWLNIWGHIAIAQKKVNSGYSAHSETAASHKSMPDTSKVDTKGVSAVIILTRTTE